MTITEESVFRSLPQRLKICLHCRESFPDLLEMIGYWLVRFWPLSTLLQHSYEFGEQKRGEKTLKKKNIHEKEV